MSLGKSGRVIFLLFSALALLAFGVGLPSFPQPNVTVHFLNTGQSDAIYLEVNDGFNALIDSGDWRKHGSVVLSYLEQLKVSKLSVLVASHQDADHIGGHAEVIEYFMARDGIDQIWDTGLAATSKTAERYLNAVEKYSDKLDIIFPVAGDEYEWGRYLTVQVFNPPEGYLPSQDCNENSMVLHVVFNNTTSFLFPGDAGIQAESAMLSEGYPLGSTVLKVSHHGSRSATTEPFFSAVNPRIALIMAPLYSQYGHPHTEVLDRLCERGLITYWTGIHGNIKLSVDAQGIINTSVEHQTTTDPCKMAKLKE